MGITLVLLAWAAVLLVIAGVTGVVFAGIAAVYARKLRSRRFVWPVVFGLFPVACVVYAGVWFTMQAAIEDSVFHHDPGLGDGWWTDIGKGYAIDMIDVTDQGIVYTFDGPDRGLNGPHSLRGVRRLQVTPGHLYGSQDSKGSEDLGQETNHEDVFFSLNTVDHSVQSFSYEAELRSQAHSSGTVLALKPLESVYAEYRFTWFDRAAEIVLFSVPLCVFSALIWGIRKARKNGLQAASS